MLKLLITNTSEDKRLYSCGSNSHGNALRPASEVFSGLEEIKGIDTDAITCVDLGTDHSLFVMNGKELYTAGIALDGVPDLTTESTNSLRRVTLPPEMNKFMPLEMKVRSGDAFYVIYFCPHDSCFVRAFPFLRKQMGKWDSNISTVQIICQQ